jgi:hypothetical protein
MRIRLYGIALGACYSSLVTEVLADSKVRDCPASLLIRAAAAGTTVVLVDELAKAISALASR